MRRARTLLNKGGLHLYGPAGNCLFLLCAKADSTVFDLPRKSTGSGPFSLRVRMKFFQTMQPHGYFPETCNVRDIRYQSS